MWIAKRRDRDRDVAGRSCRDAARHAYNRVTLARFAHTYLCTYLLGISV